MPRFLRCDWRAISLGLSTAIVFGSVVPLAVVSRNVFRSRPPLVVEPESIIEAPLLDNYVAYEQARSLVNVAELATFSRSTAAVRLGETWVETSIHCVTRGFFETLGVAPKIGRGFASQESLDLNSVVLSEEFWTHKLDRAALSGLTLRVGGRPFDVIGIAPKGFAGGFRAPASAWLLLEGSPTLCSGAGYNLLPSDTASWLTTLARLRPGATADALSEQLRPIKLSRRNGSDPLLTRMQTLTDAYIADHRRERTLLVWLDLSALALLLLCSWNGATLFALRGLAGVRDLRIRASLGASKRHLVGEILREPVMTIGVAVLTCWVPLVWASNSLAEFIAGAEQLEWPQVTAALALVVASVAAIWIGSAFVSARAALGHGTKSIATTGMGRSIRYVEATLLAVTVASATALLASAGVFIKAISTLSNDLGYSPANLQVVSIDVRRSRIALDEDVQPVREQLAESFRRAGVTDIALASIAPLDYASPRVFIGVRRNRDGRPLLTNINFVSPTYFTVVNTPLVQGRAAISSAGEPEIVIDDSLAGRLFDGESPLGKCVYVMQGQECLRVVGTSRPRRARQVTQRTAEVFLPLQDASRYSTAGLGRTILVRTDDPARISAVTSQVSAGLGAPIEVRTATSLLSAQQRPWRLGSRSLSALGILSLLLGGIGLSAAIGLRVSRQTLEIGIRMALGASKPNIFRYIATEGVVILMVGLAMGAVAGKAFFSIVQARISNLQPADWLLWLWVTLLVTLVSACAIAIPAWFATTTSALRAMRSES